MRLLSVLCLFALSLTPLSAQRIRAIHASPDAPNVDIYVDGRIALQNIPFTQASDYVSVPAGQREIAIFVTGTQTRVASVTQPIGSGVDYSAIAVGFADGKRTPALSVLVVQDNTADPGAGFARVRLIHAAPSAPAVDAYYTAPFLALANQTALATGVVFRNASAFVTVPAGPLAQVRFTLAGDKTPVIQSEPISFMSGQIRTILAIDAKGGGAPFGLLTVRDRN